MTVRISITNSLTNEVVVNTMVKMADSKAFSTNLDCMIQAFPDCEIIFEDEEGQNYASTRSLNQRNDEELVATGWMSYDDFVAKWYSHA